MISIQQYIYNTLANTIQTNTGGNRRMQIQAGSIIQEQTHLLTSDFGSSTRGERQFLKVFRNYTMLTTPPTLGTFRGGLDLNSSLPVEIRKIQPYTSTVETPTTRLHGRELTSLSQWQKLNCLPAWPNLKSSTSTVCLNGPKSTPNWLLFKIFKFSGPSLPGLTTFTLQLHFLSGVYNDNCDCHIFCVRA